MTKTGTWPKLVGYEYMNIRFWRTANILIRLCRCTGSESSLGALEMLYVLSCSGSYIIELHLSALGVRLAIVQILNFKFPKSCSYALCSWAWLSNSTTDRHQLQVFEPPRDKTNKMACAPSEDSDQPGIPPSLIRVFAIRMKKAQVLTYPMSVNIINFLPCTMIYLSHVNLTICNSCHNLMSSQHKIHLYRWFEAIYRTQVEYIVSVIFDNWVL